MTMHRFQSRSLLGCALMLLIACGGEGPGARVSEGPSSPLGSSHAAGTNGVGASGSLYRGGTSGSLDPGAVSTEGSGNANSGSSAGTNSAANANHAADHGSIGSTGGDGAAAGPPGTEHGVGRGGSGGISSTGGRFEEGDQTTSDTFDVGKSGVGGTFDFRSGIGGTLDTGIGGTIDTGIGGTIDTGTGGTIDTGAGGTIDTCIPTCTPDLLGVGEKAVNLVVFDDATASGCDTEGRMWVGGNAKLDGYGVGAQLVNCDATDPVLVVGGDLTAAGGVNGRIWVGGTFSGNKPKCGSIDNEQPPPVDFPFLETQLTAYSRLLASYPVNGTVANNYGALSFKGADADMNIFAVDGASLATANGLIIDVPVTSTVIINVTGTTAAFNGGTTTLPDRVTCGSGAVRLDDFCNQLVWNMPTVKTLTISGTAVQGTILAPVASLSGGGANVNGTVIVNEFAIDGCVEMHPHYFNGCLCTKEADSLYACCPP